MKYTVVQHSGHAKPGFAKGLESAAVERHGTEEKILASGGRIFDSYSEAEDYAHAEQYQPDNHGIYPKAPGSFAALLVGGRKLYVPKPDDYSGPEPDINNEMPYSRKR